MSYLDILFAMSARSNLPGLFGPKEADNLIILYRHYTYKICKIY